MFYICVSSSFEKATIPLDANLYNTIGYTLISNAYPRLLMRIQRLSDVRIHKFDMEVKTYMEHEIKSDVLVVQTHFDTF